MIVNINWVGSSRLRMALRFVSTEKRFFTYLISYEGVDIKTLNCVN